MRAGKREEGQGQRVGTGRKVREERGREGRDKGNDKV